MAFQSFDNFNPASSRPGGRAALDTTKPFVQFSVGTFTKQQSTSVLMSKKAMQLAGICAGDRVELQLDVDKGLGMIAKVEEGGYIVGTPTGKERGEKMTDRGLVRIVRTNVAKQFRPCRHRDNNPTTYENGAIVFSLPKSYVNDLRNHQNA